VKAEAFHDDTQIEQRFYDFPEERMSAVTKVLPLPPASCVAFCFTKQQVQETVDHLTAKGISAVGLHGDLEQRDRDQVWRCSPTAVLRCWWPPTSPPVAWTSTRWTW
jgi:ATP-independent RNA helicase DbpA